MLNADMLLDLIMPTYHWKEERICFEGRFQKLNRLYWDEMENPEPARYSLL